jgi:hypothetical protein
MKPIGAKRQFSEIEVSQKEEDNVETQNYKKQATGTEDNVG